MNKIFKVTMTSLLALGAAGVFTSCNKQPASPAAEVNVAGIAAGELKIATVNMDAVNEGFQMVVDIQNELEQTEKRLTNDIQRQATQLQTDYDNYLKIGATLTLAEQKKREESLTQRQQNIATLQQTYANQMANLQVQRMEEMRQFILRYIERFEAENGPFTMVIMTGTNSGVLFAQPALDITDVILQGLNDEYKADKDKESKKK